MNCEEERKLFKLRMETENQFKSISLPLATKPLGVKTPPGHNLTKERREAIDKAREKLRITREAYQGHIKSCSNCHQRKT